MNYDENALKLKEHIQNNGIATTTHFNKKCNNEHKISREREKKIEYGLKGKKKRFKA